MSYAEFIDFILWLIAGAAVVTVLGILLALWRVRRGA